MKRPSWPPAVIRIVPMLLLTLVLVSASGTASTSSTPQNIAVATATGKLSVQWEDPYLPARISLASGNESITVQGDVTPSNTYGYYVMPDPSVSGTVKVEWNANATSYKIDGIFEESYSAYQVCTTFPAANAFSLSYIYFYGQVTINGTATRLRSSAAILAETKGVYSYHGTARSTVVIIYSPSFHADQFVLRWSQSAQTIYGIEQPVASAFTQTVQTG